MTAHGHITRCEDRDQRVESSTMSIESKTQYEQVFTEQLISKLPLATFDLSWLLSKGYVINSSLKLVGDRYRLPKVARHAVKRAACSDQSFALRSAKRVYEASSLQGKPVWIDGFNQLITLERALRGDPVFRCRDGIVRDIAGVHGTYRLGQTTEEAFSYLTSMLKGLGVSQITWLFDQPVSNSGKIVEMARKYGEAHVVRDPDIDLINAPEEVIVCSGDGVIIERARSWFNLIDTLCNSSRVDLGFSPIDLSKVSQGRCDD